MRRTLGALFALFLAIPIAAGDLAAEPQDASRSRRRVGPARPIPPQVRVKIVTTLEVIDGREKLKGVQTDVGFVDGLRSRSEHAGSVFLRGLGTDPLSVTVFGDPRGRVVVVPGPTPGNEGSEDSELPLSRAQPSSRREDLGTQQIQGSDATGTRWIMEFPARTGVRERPYTRTVETWTNASGDWIRQRTWSSVDREVTVTDSYHLPVAELPRALFEVPAGVTARMLGASDDEQR